jgi:uncharacterized protein (DUF58 family)
VPALIAIAVVAMLLNAGFLATLVYVLAFVAIGARLWVWHLQRRLTLRRLYDSRIFNGETTTVTLEVRNSGLISAPWVLIRDRLPLKLGYPQPFTQTVMIPARDVTRVQYQVRGIRRGLYPLGPLALSFGDALGLHEGSLREPVKDFLIVYPKTVPLAGFHLSSKSPLGALRSPEPWHEDPARVAGLRDYERGDSVRRVSWSATARVGRLQVKKLDSTLNHDTVIALNLCEEEYDQAQYETGSELGIVAAASIARRLDQLHQSVGLLCNGLDPLADQHYDPADPDSVAASTGDAIWIAPHKGQAQVMRILDVLARVAGGRHVPFVELLRRSTVDVPWGATIVVITSDETAGLPETILGLQRRGFLVVALFVASVRSYRPRATRTESLGVRITRAWKEDDLRGVFA